MYIFCIPIIKELDLIAEFSKQMMDIKNERIEFLFSQISTLNLVYLPTGAINIYELHDLNVEHRKKVEQIIALKSVIAEKATIELINRYVEEIQISTLSRKGERQYQLPKDKITPENSRVEELKPIDKFDWISFEKVFRPVAIINESERSEYCKRRCFSNFLLQLNNMVVCSFQRL